MKPEAINISRLKSDLGKWASVCLVSSAAIGASFVFVTVNTNKTNSLFTQPIRGLNCDERVIRQADQRCVVCGQDKAVSEFASKGKGRLSRHCRSCDNDRRRAAYRPRTDRINRPKWTVYFEAAVAVGEEQKGYIVSTILELLTEQRIILTAIQDNEDPDVNGLIRRKSVIDEIT